MAPVALVQPAEVRSSSTCDNSWTSADLGLCREDAPPGHGGWKQHHESLLDFGRCRWMSTLRENALICECRNHLGTRDDRLPAIGLQASIVPMAVFP